MIYLVSFWALSVDLVHLRSLNVVKPDRSRPLLYMVPTLLLLLVVGFVLKVVLPHPLLAPIRCLGVVMPLTKPIGLSGFGAPLPLALGLWGVLHDLSSGTWISPTLVKTVVSGAVAKAAVGAVTALYRALPAFLWLTKYSACVEVAVPFYSPVVGVAVLGAFALSSTTIHSAERALVAGWLLVVVVSIPPVPVVVGLAHTPRERLPSASLNAALTHPEFRPPVALTG